LEAIDAVQSAPYDLVLMDVQMRRLDGVSAARRIRALDHPASLVPIVALTANVMVQQVNFYREAGMNDFIPKPFTRERLRTSVARWLQSGTPGTVVADPDARIDEEHDPQSLEDTRELMGDDWVRASLGRLRDQISELFLVPSAAMLDQATLIRGAHIVVASSAQLGFSALSRRCSELEEHSIAGDCIDLPLANAQRSSLLAAKKIDELLNIVGYASSVSTFGIASH
jgi:hypothetical protein